MKAVPLVILISCVLPIGGCGHEEWTAVAPSQKGAIQIAESPPVKSVSRPAVEEQPKPKKTASTAILSYETLKEESSDSGSSRKLIRRHILLHGSLTNDSIIATLRSIYETERANTRNGVTLWQLAIFAYADRAHFEDGSAHWVGMVDADNDDEPRIQVSDIQLNPPASATSDGLSVGRRKEIFYALVAAQDKAEMESNAAHPDPNDFNAQFDTQNSLSEKYERKVRHKYHISEELATAIKGEGAVNQWSMPKDHK